MQMNPETHRVPEFGKRSFHCPLCNVYAEQYWPCVYHRHFGVQGDYTRIESLSVAICNHCGDFSVWLNKKPIFPRKISALPAHKDMPEAVLEYYNEAREVSVSSHRAAAALLRLAAKKLCEELGEDEANLNRAIGNLNKKGLPQSVIKSLDTVRIVGNEGGAHEGRIDLTGKDNKEIVDKLFWLINFIVEKTITEPREIRDSFDSLPDDKKRAVEKRAEGIR